MRKGKFKIKQGFLLVEVLISISILLLTVATTITLMSLGYGAINFNKNNMEAVWLAHEGISAVRGIRDTNWLRYSFDKDTCWNVLDNACTPASNRFTVNSYFLETNKTGGTILKLSGVGELDLNNGPDDPSNQTYQLFYEDNDGDRINDYISHSGAIESKFYREIRITNVTATQIEGSVYVQWIEGSVPKTVALPFTLTNYLRES